MLKVWMLLVLVGMAVVAAGEESKVTEVEKKLTEMKTGVIDVLKKFGEGIKSMGSKTIFAVLTFAVAWKGARVLPQVAIPVAAVQWYLFETPNIMIVIGMTLIAFEIQHRKNTSGLVGAVGVCILSLGVAGFSFW